MSSHTVPVPTPLPRSHYFLTVSRGSGMRTIAIRAGLIHLLACLLPLLGVVGTGATAYVLFHDEVVASLMARQSRMQYAYEDRIDALRGELQRQTLRQISERNDLDGKLRELMSREAKLESRADIVASLADLTGGTAMPQLRPPARQVKATGERPLRVANPLAQMQPALPALPSEALGYAPPPPSEAFANPKPHPEADPVQPDTPVQKSADHLSELDSDQLTLPTRLSLVTASLDKIEQLQVGSLLRIGTAARDESARIEAVIEDVGLSSNRFRREVPRAQGGPFVPLSMDRGTPFGQAMAGLQDSLASAVRLRGAMARMPLADPLPGTPEITSPFGARMDPFLGRPALHPGVDLRENFGTDIRATAAGRVSVAGPAGGYGNMVEVDHGSGLVTRYAHMAEIAVSEGQMVAKDTILGRVGATGRATGPHLHYEIRVDGEPVDPMRFVNVGLRLARAEPH